LPLLISDLSVATSLVEVSEKGVPGFRIAGLSAKSLNYPRHHAIHRRLAGMITFPPVSQSGPRPVRGGGVVRPHDAPRVEALRDTDRPVRNGVICQHQ